MSTTTVEAPTRFHLSLNVSDLPQAVAFFQNVLGVGPAKQRADYAKFELESPPLVLSLEPRSPAANGSLNHVGFRFPDAPSLVAAQRRLEEAGVRTQREEGVECCYARQTKFWVHDLDHRLWEFYTLEDDLDHRGAGQTLEQMVGQEAASGAGRPPVIWEHRMNEPFTPPAEPCDDVRLRGTFNIERTDAERDACLAQAFAALRPGGSLLVHVLTAEQPFAGNPDLPGRAGSVEHVPVRSALLAAIEAAAFSGISLTTFRPGACFEVNGQALRETQIVARRPRPASSETCTLVYKGPFRQVTDDEGRLWRRGEATSVSRSCWDALRETDLASSFVELPETAPVSACGT